MSRSPDLEEFREMIANPQAVLKRGVQAGSGKRQGQV